MGVDDQSFVGNPEFQSFGGTLFEARGGAFSLLAVGGFSVPTDSGFVRGNAIIDVEAGTAKALDDNATLSPGSTRRVIFFKGKLYVSTDASFPGFVDSFAVWNKETGFWEGFNFFTGLPNDIFTLFEFQGIMLIGGIFTSVGLIADTRKVAQFDGTSISSFGSTSGVNLVNGQVDEFVVFNGSLYAVSLFASGPGPANRMSLFSGGVWIKAPGHTGFGARAAVVFQGSMFLGGILESYNGSSTTSIGVSAGDSVFAMVVYKGSLIISGDFTTVTAGLISANKVAKFDGTTWSDFSFGEFLFAGSGILRVLHIHKGKLYVADNGRIFRLNDSDPGNEVWELVISLGGNVLDLVSFKL